MIVKKDDVGGGGGGTVCCCFRFRNTKASSTCTSDVDYYLPTTTGVRLAESEMWVILGKFVCGGGFKIVLDSERKCKIGVEVALK